MIGCTASGAGTASAHTGNDFLRIHFQGDGQIDADAQLGGVDTGHVLKEGQDGRRADAVVAVEVRRTQFVYFFKGKSKLR